VTEHVREWLPFGVVTDDAVRRVVEDAITRWHERWFVGPYASVSEMQAVCEAPWGGGGGDDGWYVYCSVVAIRARRQSLSGMVDKVLGLGGDGQTMNDADRYIVKGLEKKIVESLAIDVEQAFGLTGTLKAASETRDGLAENGGLLVVLKDSAGRDILALGIPTETTLPVIKAQLGPPSARQERLYPLADALASAVVTVEAIVGRVELTLMDLNHLSVGDVLVLDSAVDEPVDIASAGSHRIFARAKLSQVQDGIALVF
jgi:flagellar motor switch/type III secretory pathway protein FliN